MLITPCFKKLALLLKQYVIPQVTQEEEWKKKIANRCARLKGINNTSN